MAIDLGNSDSRKSYLKDKLDDLLDGIHESYTSVLMDELISRLERTVNDFNLEVKELMSLLKEEPKKRKKFWRRSSPENWGRGQGLNRHQGRNGNLKRK